VTSTRAILAVLLAASLPGPGAAQDRPREEDLFGKPEERPAEAAPAPAPSPDRFAKPPSPSGEAAGRPPEEARVKGKLGDTDNPTQIGGMMLLRANASALEQRPLERWSLSAPSIADLYLDARPFDRVRAFGLLRTTWDPTLATPSSPLASLSSPGSSTSTLQSKLDQLWLKADIGRTVFVTAGRQHVKWGIGHFWSPTDYLHQARRNPFGFDDRTGTGMVKLHLPWERRGWNLYAMAVFDPLVVQPVSLITTPRPGATDQLGSIGGAARAEVVWGSWEIGIDGAAQRGMDPRLGIDFSTGLWEIDVRGEVGLRQGSDVPLWRVPGPGLADPAALQYTPSGLRTAAVLSAEWQHKYSDEDTYTIGAEYFWNQNGYGDAHVYPVLMFAGAYNPLYLGRHYGGLYFLLPRPGDWNLHTFTLSALANLSDKSVYARLDWSATVLTYLTLETYLAGHLGKLGSEFRPGEDIPARDVVLAAQRCTLIGGTVTGTNTCRTPAVPMARPVVDVGVTLRMSL
jgi:hypothetical protein